MGPILVIGFLVFGMLLFASALVAMWRLSRPVVVVVAWNAFPPTELERQSNLAATLGECGFGFAGFQRKTCGSGEPVWQSLFRFAEGAIWAVMEALPDETPRIVLHTFFEDGHTLTTSSGSFLDYNTTADWELKEGSWSEFREQAQCHWEAALSSGAKPVSTETADEFREHYEATSGKEIDELRKRGIVKEHPGKEGAFKWANWKAPLKAPGLLWSASRYDWIFKGSKPAKSHIEEIAESDEEEEDVDLFTLYGRSKRRQSTLTSLDWTKRGAILFGTIVAMLLTFLLLDKITIPTAIIITAVIIVHELCHVLAMRLTGVRDDRVMVLPLLARWTGRRKLPFPARQQLFILLMGPLPGMLVGWGLLALVHSIPALPGYLTQLAFWLVLYNNLNLLPFLPFDGGRMANLLVFDRFPTLRLVYFLATGLLMISVVLVTQFVLGWTTWPLLFVPATTMLALPDMIRTIQPGRSAKADLSARTDETEALRKAAQIVEEDKALSRLETARQIEFVDKVLGWGCTKRMGATGTVLAVLLVLAALATPLWVLIGLTVRENSQVRTEQRLIETRVTELEAGMNRPGMAVARRTRSELKLLTEDYQQALAHMYSGDADIEADPEIIEFDSRGIYDPGEALQIVRHLPWDQVAAWIAEGDSQSRQETARVLVQTLIGDAREQTISGNHRRAMDSLSKAYFASSKCEPTDSLASWIDWLYLERDILNMLETALGAGHLHPQYTQWFEKALRSRSEVDGRKLAVLLLHDLGGAPGPAGSAANSTTGVRETNDLVAGNAASPTIGQFLASQGIALRRSQPDLDYRRRKQAPVQSPGLENVLSFTRILRGLPTREEHAAGMAVAENWAGGRAIDPVVAYELENLEQRRIWEARILCMDRLIRYRHLGAETLTTQLSGHAPNLVPGSTKQARSAGTQATLVRGDTKQYAVAGGALDGTRLRWRLSPDFRPKKAKPPVPEPDPVAPVVVANTPQPAKTPPAEPQPVETPKESPIEPAEPVILKEAAETGNLDEFNLLDEFERMRTGPVAGDFPAPVVPAE